MASQVSSELRAFDRLAAWVSDGTSRALLFALCVITVAVWAPSYFVFGKISTWQLVINTLTAIVTFLLVGPLQNTQHRADAAVQHELSAIADALVDLLDSSVTPTRALAGIARSRSRRAGERSAKAPEMSGS